MEQLPMRKKSTALIAVMVALVLVMALSIGYLLYVNHSTISSLKSELSKKDQVIETKDDLIQQQNAIIDEGNTKLNEQQKQMEDQQKEVEEKSKQVEDLQKQVALKLEKEKRVQALAYTPSTPASEFQDGWKASFYSLGIESTGKRPGQSGYGITASGRAVQKDITIAVDPKQIPLGSWVEIQFPDGHVEKRRADDTGSAIKGRKIDVYISNATEKQLNQLGIQQIKIKVLKGDQAV